MSHIDLPCPTCGASGRESPCVTRYGKVAAEPHQARKKLGFTYEMQLPYIPDATLNYRKGDPPDSPDGKIKLAMWYITTIGGIEEAEKALKAAKAALEAFK